MKSVLFALAVSVSVWGCNHDKPTDAAPAMSAAPAPAATSAEVAPTAAPSPAEPAPVSPAVVAAIPAEEDFETQAATTITASNASQQLTQLEKEIGK